MYTMSMLKYLIFIFILMGCNQALEVSVDESPIKGSKVSLSFDDSSKFTYDENTLDFLNNEVSLLSLNLTQSESSFNQGTHEGTYYNTTNENLTVRDKNNASLDVRNILSSESDFLEGYWRFEDSPVDSSANALPTVNTNGNRFSTNSIVGSHSSSTGGGTDGILASNIPVMNTFSITTWMYLNAHGDWARVFVKGLDVSNVDWAFTESSTGTFRFHLDTSCYGTYFPIDENEWNHLSITFDGTRLKSYLNGEEVDSTGCSVTPTNMGDKLIMGANLDGYSDSRANLDEFALWSKALSESDIKKIYNTQKPTVREMDSTWITSWDKIIGYWKMNDNADDSSSKGHDGNVTGAYGYRDIKKLDKSLYLNGADAQLRANSIDTDFNRAQGTMSCWIYNEIDEGDVESRFLTRFYVDATNEISSRFLPNDTFRFRYEGQGNLVDASIPNWSEKIPRNEWTHIAMTWDIATANEIKLYINSNLESTATQSMQMSTGAIDFFSFGYGTNGFKGELNECAVWSDALRSSEISEIYQQQSDYFLGAYTSSIIDTGNTSSTWDNLSVETVIPYSKALTSSSEQGDYTGIGSDLSVGLVSYWDFNETSLDSAAGSKDIDDNIGTNALTESGGVAIDRQGIQSRGALLDGVDDYLVAFDDPSLRINSNLTLSIWIRSNGELADSGVYGGLIGKTNFGGSVDYGIMIFNSAYQFIVRQTDATYITSIVNFKPKVVDGNWHHLVGVANASTGEVKVYIDGVLQADTVNTSYDGTIQESAKNLIFGRDYGDRYFNGKLDEAAIWNRALSSDEISQLYKRGAYKVSYQVRSCSVSDCSDGQWIGAKGSDGSYFTELDNNDSILAGLPVGNPLPTAMDFEYSNYVEKPADNRYFQYKILMNSVHEMTCMDESCPPAVNQISLASGTQYFSDYTAIEPKSPLTISQVDSITVDSSGSCSLTFQISSDGVSYVYWDGSSWTTASQNSQSNTIADITSHFTSFGNSGLETNLYIKTIMKSDSTQSCSVKEIIINDEI